MDMRVIRDTESDWPNTLPSKEHFENCISKVSNKLLSILVAIATACIVMLCYEFKFGLQCNKLTVQISSSIRIAIFISVYSFSIGPITSSVLM